MPSRKPRTVVSLDHMHPLAQLIIAMPFVILFALIVAAFMRQENQRLHRIDAANRRRHPAHQMPVYRPVPLVRAQRPDKEAGVHRDPPPVHRTA